MSRDGRLQAIEAGVSDIDAKLEQARARSKEYGLLYGKKEVSDDRMKIVYAIQYDSSEGTVAERDAFVKRSLAYLDAVTQKENAYADWKEAEIWMKLLLLEAEIWRTQQANNRMIDQGHR